METNDKIKIAGFLIVAILVIIIVWRILGKVGLVESKEAKEKKNAVENLRTSAYFDPSYYKGKVFASIGQPAAELYAKEIYNAKGIFNDDEEALYSTFSKLKNKCNISEVAEHFYNLYKKDLKSFILGFLSEKEMTNLQTIINKLPNY